MPVLVLCADAALRQSLGELLLADGRALAPEPGVPPRPSPNGRLVVVAACDAWPPGWNVARVRRTFARAPCLMLSGSPLGGDFAAAELPNGYFAQLPALPSTFLGLVAELSAA